MLLVHCASPSCAPIQSATELTLRKPGQVGWRPLGPTPNDSGDPARPADQRRGVLGRSGQDGTDARPCRPGPHGLWSPVAATPDTDAQPRRLELSGPRPPVAATRIIKPCGLVTKDHGPGSSNPDGSLESRLGLRDSQGARRPGIPGTGGPWTEHPGPVAATNSSLYHRT